MYILKKLFALRIWQRVFLERLSEPLHLNLISLFVAVFGSLRSKIFFDLCVRQQHAFGLLEAAGHAARYGYRNVTVIEFGVANGAGLLNICHLAKRISKVTGISFHIVGFDGAGGMPPIHDYRDHPELYQPGWYPMQAPDALKNALPHNASLILGEISETVPSFLAAHGVEAPIGFVSIDVDYYWSAVEALKCMTAGAEHYLPMTVMYFDDVDTREHNPWCGELLAIDEFNAENRMRKISRINFLRERRLFKNASWIGKMYAMHVLDHPARLSVLSGHGHIALGNPYLDIPLQE